jgi:hypothetical protein
VQRFSHGNGSSTLAVDGSAEIYTGAPFSTARVARDALGSLQA